MIGEFLKFPKIIASILLGVVAYQVSFYFENPAKYLAVLFVSLFLFAVPMSYSWFKNRKIDGKRFLAIEFSLFYLGSLTFPQLGMNSANFFKEELQQNHLFLLPFICFWVLGFLFCITAVHLQNNIIKTIKKQYQLS